MEVVVDANVLLHGRGKYPFDRAITVKEVLEEVKSNKGKNMLQKIDYSVEEPGSEALKKVENVSKKINSPTSKPDEKVLALALDTGNKLQTDDKALQNLALHLETDFDGYIDSPADEKFRWKIKCKNCGEKVEGDKCSNCGSSRLRRRQVRCSSE